MYVVTGGLGFIGSRIVRHLNRAGHTDIVICDRYESLRDGRFKNVEGLDYVDFIDQSEILEYIRKAPVVGVFHQGAITDTMNDDPTAVMQCNLDFSKRLLTNYMASSFTQGVKFIYASSAAVYGSLNPGPICERKERPLNIYGFSKLAFDNWARRMGSVNQDARIIGLRYHNVYGPNESHKGRMASFVYQKVIEGLLGGPVRFFAPEASRDFVHVDDVARVNVHLMLCRLCTNASGIYDVGTGTSTPVRQLVDLICEETGAEPLEIDMPKDFESRYQMFTRAMTDPLRAAVQHPDVLDFISIEDGIGQMVALARTGVGVR